MTALSKPVHRRIELPRGVVTVSLWPDRTIEFREYNRHRTYRLPLALVFRLAAEEAARLEALARRKRQIKPRRVRRGSLLEGIANA